MVFAIEPHRAVLIGLSAVRVQYDRGLMSGFPGGSAWAMARDICEAHLLVNERTFSRLKDREMDTLQFELDRLLRSVRGTQVETGATRETQMRQRRMQRLTGAKRMLQAYIQRTRRQAPKR